ncbi:P-loop containing nucleoside triphosphate hydrolase protein [Lophiostoma macrostomum CBS 122681]|uniref:P-loop containing nucleoside triphosphate hydrolase protein n=1 Tax=Lophiostoma macrostomum CBS 122681 TaxID=1314788 RepID=A0A6A6TD56_9PLEO|nr:P-loop containing nucleoside triphosphate hydrolase protein [Lophiostoma macrostomum CBS 122681]
MPKLQLAPSQRRRVVVLGESRVGKTCFCDMFVTGEHWADYNPVEDTLARFLNVDGVQWELGMMDLSCTPIREHPISLTGTSLSPEYIVAILSKGSGFVLLYDITSQQSFENITQFGYGHLIKHRRPKDPETQTPYPAGIQRFGCVLVGNKVDLAPDQREVDSEVAQEWADSQGIPFFELDTRDREAIEEAMRAMVKSLARAERRDKEDLEEERRLIVEERKRQTKSDTSVVETEKRSGNFRKGVRNALRKLKI